MITRTLIDKSTTIKKDNKDNFGLNPVCMLSYGFDVTRALVHFNVEKLRKMVDNKTYSDLSKLRHTLSFKNCASINFKNNRDKIPYNDLNGYKERAVSFTVIAIKVNKHWDMGIGFDNTNDVWVEGKTAVSQYGATWFNSTTEEEWDEGGIYNLDFIEEQYEKYINQDFSASTNNTIISSANTSGITGTTIITEISGITEASGTTAISGITGTTDNKSGWTNNTIIVGAQKFDVGNENFEIDITDYVNKLILGEEENYGICLMFSPQLERSEQKSIQYVGFFNEKTNTIFTPVLETRYDSQINDNRFSFYLNKNNHLYLYSIIGDKFTNLDRIPTCTVDDVEYEVKQETKGVYYIDIKLDSKKYKPNQIIYDVWSNIVYNGEVLEDIELEFVTHSQKMFFNIDETIRTPKTLTPFLIGINNNESITIGEIRTNKLFFRVPYTHTDYILNDSAEYRLYVKDGDREVTIIDWDSVMNISKYGLFTIDTTTLVPSEYHIDIRVHFGEEVRIFKNETTFKIVSDVTNQKR